MSTTRKVVSVSLAVALGLGAAGFLTACSPQQLVQDAVENAVEDATGVDVDVDTGADGSVSMPSDFPSDVPVISGNLVSAGSFSGMWSITVQVNDVESAYNEAKSKLESAGFTSSMDIASDGTYSGAYGNAKYSVLLFGEDGSDGKIVSYTVAPTSG